MMNTSAIKEQQQDLISILTTELEKEKKDSISILTTLLEQKKAQLKEVQSIPTKISRALDTLVPITTEYPDYKKAIASQLGLALPTPPKPRVIEIIDEQENNPTPTITIKEIITELTSTFPEDWKYNETDSTWEIALTETEVTRITQNTNNPTGTIELKEKLYQWNLHETDGDLPITILALQEEENNNDTTSDSNAKTDSTHIEKSGDVPTPHTSDTVEDKNTPNNPTVTWYNSMSGEVGEGSEKRYFQINWYDSKGERIIKFKKFTESGNWIPPNNSTKLFADVVWEEFQAGKPDATKAILQKLYDAASEVGGKVHESNCWRVGSLGHFLFPNGRGYNDSVEIGYNDGSWWFFRPGHNKVYCDGDVNTFAQVLKGLAAETVKDAEKASTTTSDTAYDADNFYYEVDKSYSKQKQENIHAINSAIQKLPVLEELVDSQVIAIDTVVQIDNLASEELGIFTTMLTQYVKSHPIPEDEYKEPVYRRELQRFVQDLLKPLGDQIIILWYDNNTGEITINQEKRYFQILWNSKLQEYQVSLKKSLSSKKWRKDKNPTTQKFIDAIMQEFLGHKPKNTNTKAEETTENQGKASDRKYTPPEITKLILAVLGEIDLDPAADDGKHISAKKHYTIADNGLNQEWHGKVFMNPPYSCSGEWVTKLNSEFLNGRVTEAIALLPASTDTKWFQPLWNQPICFWRGRITFLDENYEVLKSPARQSHCFIYWGENIEKFSKVFNKYGEITLPSKNTQKTLTLSEKIKPYLPPTWILEEHFFNQVIIQEQNHKNNHVEVCGSTIGDIYIKHNQELLYTVNHQDIETVIDLIYSWFEQQKTVTTPSINPQKSNKNSGKNNESTVDNEPLEVEKTLTLTEKIQPFLPENWFLVPTDNNNQVFIYSSNEKNSDWVQITEISDNLTPFIVTHGSAFNNNVKSVKSAIESAQYWFDSTNSKEEVNADSSEVDIDYLDIFIEIINDYDTDLTIQRKDTSTACIQVCQKTVGTIFVKNDQTIEIAEREKQLLKESYSIDIDKLIEDIYQEKVDENPNNYLMGIDSLDAEFSNLDTLQNALHSLSNKCNLVIIRQEKTFKVYNGTEWLENYLGSVKVNDSEIISDEELSYELLNNYSILLNQLTSDIATGEKSIDTENYIITSETLKKLLTKENWDNWNEQDFDTAHNLLKELVDFSPAWNQLLETIRLKRKALIEQTTENDDDNPDNNGGSKTRPSTPKNPNNNGGIKPELNTKHLDTLETAIKSYKPDLKMNKNCSQIAFYQGHYQLGSVTINQGKLLAESKLVSHLTIFYGIDIKGLIKSIKYNSKHPSHELDPFAYISSNNNAFKTLGCVVALTGSKGRERRGILQSVSGEIATVQWLDSGVPGDNSIEKININLLRYVSAPPLTKLDSNQVSTVSLESENMDTDKQTKCDSDEHIAESITLLNLGGLIAAQHTQPSSTVEVNQSSVNNDETSNDRSAITWYDSFSGEVIVDNEHRYFHVFFNKEKEKEQFEIGIKKSETAKSWSKNGNATNQKFIDAVWNHFQENWKLFQENPSEKDKVCIIHQLQNAVVEVGDRFIPYTNDNCCSNLGSFYIEHQKIAEVGYYKNSWWFTRPGHGKVYCSGDATTFVQVLKVSAKEESTSNDTTNNQTESDSNEPTVESIAVLKVDHTPSEQRETGKSITINEQNLTINGKAISFGHTLNELLSGNKTVTRRLWKDNYAKRFIDDWNARPGEFLYPALTKGYHVGGKRVGYIRLTHKPYQEKLVDMPSSELAGEGFPQLSKQQFIGKFFQGDNQQLVWVIRFEFIPNKEDQESLSEQNNNQTSREEELIDKVEKELSLLDKFIFERILGVPKISLNISFKGEFLGRIFTDPHEGLVSDISLEKSLMERYGLDIKALIRDVINGNQIEIEKYCYKLKNIASDFFDEEDDPTWLNLIKAEIEFLEDFKASHDEVDLTVTHYGTYIGSIHHNQDDELEVELKLIGELAKYDLNLEAFLVAENIPYKLVSTKPVVVTPNPTSEHTKKSPTGSNNGSKTGSNILNKNEGELDTVYIQEPCTITKIRQILTTVAPEIYFTDDGINMVAWHNGKDLGNINVPGLPLWITYSSNLEEYLKNNCRFNLSSFVEDIEKGNLNGLPFSDLIKKLKNGNQNCKYFNSNITKNNLPVPSPTKNLDILDKLAQVFNTLENIHTERSGDRLSFYQGKIYLDSCDMMRYLDGKAPSLFPSFKLKEKFKELFAIDLAKLCFDLETGKSVDVNDYLNQSICQHTNTESSNIHETNSSQDTLKPSDTESCQHSEGLRWVEYKSIYSRDETYVVWHGTQECGKIYRRNKGKGKQKANIGKWYVSPNVFGPYYDTISEAATACWEDFVSRNAEQTATEEELIPF